MKRVEQRQASRNLVRRQRVACEAARLMAVHGLQDVQQARARAARELGFLDQASLPDYAEIEHELRMYQRLFRGDQQPGELRRRREAALQAMEFFATFQPRLVGSVLVGTADAGSAITLHLFSDEPEAFARALVQAQIPAQPVERRLRADPESIVSVPAWTLEADGLAFEFVVFPLIALRQAPLSRIDGQPMLRATAAALRRLLTEAVE